jgi:hypothetical protein
MVLSFIGVTIAGTAVAAAILAILAKSSFRDNADRLAAEGAIFSGAAVLLAVIASLVALMAYAVSTGSPDLQLRIAFPFSKLNEPSFKAHIQKNGVILADQFKQTIGRVSLHNTSRYSAVNPAVVVRFQGMAFTVNTDREEGAWEMLEFRTSVGITAIQWDGGPQYSIHGESTRVLPALHLDRLMQFPGLGEANLVIELLAEGYRKVVTIPVSFILEEGSQPEVDSVKSVPEWL